MKKWLQLLHVRLLLVFAPKERIEQIAEFIANEIKGR